MPEIDVAADLAVCIEALMEIRDGKSKYPADLVARFALLEIVTPIECGCEHGYRPCSGPECYGGKTREGGHCPVCHGLGTVLCEDCRGEGVV